MPVEQQPSVRLKHVHINADSWNEDVRWERDVVQSYRPISCTRLQDLPRVLNFTVSRQGAHRQSDRRAYNAQGRASSGAL